MLKQKPDKPKAWLCNCGFVNAEENKWCYNCKVERKFAEDKEEESV